MDYYRNEIKERLDELVADGNETRAEIIKRWADGETDDDFGNMTGSRFCSTYKAEQALLSGGFPFDYEINELLDEVGYNIGELVERGAETCDVIICELVARDMANSGAL